MVGPSQEVGNKDGLCHCRISMQRGPFILRSFSYSATLLCLVCNVHVPRKCIQYNLCNFMTKRSVSVYIPLCGTTSVETLTPPTTQTQTWQSSVGELSSHPFGDYLSSFPLALGTERCPPMHGPLPQSSHTASFSLNHRRSL